MVDLVTALGAGVVSTFLPLFGGILIPLQFVRLRPARSNDWLAAVSSGIVFWFFLDVMGDAALLDVNQGFRGDYTHPILALMFALGIVALLGLERRFSPASVPQSLSSQKEAPKVASVNKMTFAVAAMAALGIGFHALGEGVDIGSAIPNSPDILRAIGGLLPGVAYVLHKLLEGFVVGVFALFSGVVSMRRVGVLGVISGIPTVVGFFTGLPNALDPSYFFALGGAGAIYIELKLVPLFSRSARPYGYLVPLLLGFYAMYFAGLFHS